MMNACANCAHCKTAWRKTHPCKAGQVEARVRCAAGRWQRPVTGSVKDYALYTVLGRQVDSCPDYHSMSDEPEHTPTGRAEFGLFIARLARHLPAGRLFRRAA